MSFVGGEPLRPQGAARRPFAPCRDCTLQTFPELFLGSPKSLLRPLLVSGTPPPPRRPPSAPVASSGEEGPPVFPPRLSSEWAVCLEAPLISPGCGGQAVGLRAQVEALVYEKNFLFLKRATKQVGPSERTGMGQVWLTLHNRGEVLRLESCPILFSWLGPGEDGAHGRGDEWEPGSRERGDPFSYFPEVPPAVPPSTSLTIL